MKLRNSNDKLDKYLTRLKDGKAGKIKPEHVEKVIGKLETKEALVLAELETCTKEQKRQRLQRKLTFVRDQQDRAKWLLQQIADG
jgi:uncharacterized protein YaiL (DUF2058 family)